MQLLKQGWKNLDFWEAASDFQIFQFFKVFLQVFIEFYEVFWY